MFDRYAFVLNLIVQFRWQYFWVQLLSIAVIVVQKRKLTPYFLLVLTAFNLVPILPYLLPSGTQIAEQNHLLRIVQVNANSKNEDYERLLSFVRSTNPDVLLVEELNPTLDRKIRDVLPDYSFRDSRPQTTPYGIGLFSKFPVSEFRFVEPVSGGRLAILSKLKVKGEEISLVGVHLASPTTPKSWNEQILELEMLAQECRQLPRPLIVAGDFNAVPWTSRIQDFLRNLHIFDVRLGRGLNCTWPSGTPIARIPISNKYERLSLPFIHRVVMLPIDHFFVSEDLMPLRLSVGPNIGSDHYPVLLECDLKR